jgi:hypothetical protein
MNVLNRSDLQSAVLAGRIPSSELRREFEKELESGSDAASGERSVRSPGRQLSREYRNLLRRRLQRED